MTDLTPETVRAALEAATPRPWWFDNNEGYGVNAIYARHRSDTRAYESVAHAIGDSAEAEANARLTAMAPDLATAYLAQAEEIERLRKRVEAANRLAELAWYSSDETLRPHVSTYRTTEERG